MWRSSQDPPFSRYGGDHLRRDDWCFDNAGTDSVNGNVLFDLEDGGHSSDEVYHSSLRPTVLWYNCEDLESTSTSSTAKEKFAKFQTQWRTG